jgi:hypothetical protein
MIKAFQCPRRKPSTIAATLAPIQMAEAHTATTRSAVENRVRRFHHWVRNATLEFPHDAALFAESMNALLDPAPEECPTVPISGFDGRNFTGQQGVAQWSG